MILELMILLVKSLASLSLVLAAAAAHGFYARASQQPAPDAALAAAVTSAAASDSAAVAWPLPITEASTPGRDGQLAGRGSAPLDGGD